MENKKCSNCGLELNEDQLFCSNCGTKYETPKEEMTERIETQGVTNEESILVVDEKSTIENSVVDSPNQSVSKTVTCSKCGNILQQNQDFCPNCGTKAGFIVDNTIVDNINAFNQNLEVKKKKGGKKKIAIIIMVVAVVIAFFGFVFRDSIIPFNGYYKCVSADNKISYSFNKDTYTYTDSSDDGKTYTRGFIKDGKILKLTDDDGEIETFRIAGNYIYRENKYEESLVSNKQFVDQKFSYSFDTTLSGYDVTFTRELVLKDDGTYHYRLYADSKYTSNYEFDDEKGTYEIGNGVITFICDGETTINIIEGNNIYYNVYEKQ